MLPSIAASSSGHWNQDGSRRWQRCDAALGDAQPDQHVAAEALRPAPAPRPACAPAATRRLARPAGRSSICSIRRQALLDLLDADPDARIDVALGQHRHVEVQRVVGRVAGRAPRVEIAARGAADEAAGAEAPRQFGAQHAGADRAILQRRGVVIQLHQRREAQPHFAQQRAQRRRALRRQVARDAAGHDRVHHQPMAEARRRGAQHALAQHRAMRLHQREGGVVADGADIAEMVGDPLQLRHQRAQPHGARRRLGRRRRLGGAREGERVGHRAVAADPPGQPRGLVQRGALHQRLDALCT